MAAGRLPIDGNLGNNAGSPAADEIPLARPGLHRKRARINGRPAAVGVTVDGFGVFPLPLSTIGGILWLAPFAAWTIATTTWSRDLYPEDKRGQFAGYYVLFNVAFTMIPGPLLGGWLASTYGIATVLDGKPGYIPTPILFQVAAALVLLAVIPLLTIRTPKAK